MLSPFLRAKHAWESGRQHEAIDVLNVILGGNLRTPTIHVPERIVEAYAPSAFENLVGGLLMSDEYLLIPFDLAVTRLWNAFPTQFVLRCLELRQRSLGDVGEGALQVVYEAAANGLLSRDPRDREQIAKVVLTAEDYPHLAGLVDLGRLEASIRGGAEQQARANFIFENRDLIANLFLYAVFYTQRVIDRDVVFIRLTGIAESQSDLLAEVGDTMARLVSQADTAEDVVRVGLRNESGSPACIEALAAACHTRQFDPFIEQCVSGSSAGSSG